MKCLRGIDRSAIRKVLVVKTSSLGDVIHSFPALVVLNKILPEAEIDFLINPQFADLLDYSPVPIRKKVIYERKKIGSLRYCLTSGVSLVRRLRKEKYDLVIDFQGLFRSSIFAFLAKAVYGACGFSEPREKVSRLFYRHTALCRSVHAVDRNVELLNGLFGTNYHVPAVDIPGNPDIEFPAGIPERYTLLLPGARWKSKCFPASLFSDIASALVSAGRKVVLAGSPDEEAVCLKIMENTACDSNIINTAGKTDISQLFELIRHAESVVCNDSGPLHIASVMNKNIFCFFGPTRAEKTGPWNIRARVYTSDIECAGCLKRECPLQNAPCHELDRNRIINDILSVEI